MRVTISKKENKALVALVMKRSNIPASEAIENILDNYRLSLELLSERGKTVHFEHQGFITPDNVISLLEKRIGIEKQFGF